MSRFDRAHMIFYYRSIVTMALSYVVSTYSQILVKSREIDRPSCIRRPRWRRKDVSSGKTRMLIWRKYGDMLSRFDTILETVWDGRDRRTDGQNCYINIARHIAVLTRDKNDIEQGSLSENATWDNIWECCGVDSSDAYRVFQKKVAFHLKLLKIFSLRLGLFAWNFCRFIGSSFRHISANFCTFILIFHQMALIFYTSTHRFHRVKFWVLNADASWARTWWESHHLQLYFD